MSKKTVLEGDAMCRSLQRMAHEILEKNPGSFPLAFIGIHTRGIPLARRLHQLVCEIDPDRKCEGVGELDISFHRDDFGDKLPVPHSTEILFDIDDKCVVLVDDVFFTGRTIRAAMNALNDLGRPKAIRLAVLVDRGHRQLPIRADFVGKNIPTAYEEKVICHLEETDGADEVFISEGGAS
ncbi:MAG: bifunctional pyr operon transcriptional regulator/uracil phosphoribosyltransferase PyrR [Verrucomicrobiota bacterium]